MDMERSLGQLLVTSAESDVRNRIKKLVKRNSDKDTCLCTSDGFEVLGENVILDRSQHEERLERDSAKNQEETQTWCTKVTKKRSVRFKDTQLTQTMHLQFLQSGHGEEMVNGLDEGWTRVSSIMDSGAAESVALPTTCPAKSIEPLAAND